MKQNPFRNWILSVLIFWGIPATLIWAGFGFFFQMALEWEFEDEFQKIDNSLNLVSEGAERYLDNAFNRGFERLCAPSIKSPEFTKRRTSFENEFPPGLVRFFYFDELGKIIPTSPEKSPISLEGFFAYISRPYEEDSVNPPERFKAMEEFHPEPNDLAAYLREHNGRIIDLVSDKLKFSRFPTWAFFQKQEKPERGKLGGILAFVYFHSLSESFLLERSLEESAPIACNVGFFVPREKSRPPFQLPPSDFRSLIHKFLSESSTRFAFGNNLVGVRTFGSNGILFGIGFIPKGPIVFLVLAFILYFLLSFFSILWLWKVFHGKESFPFKLSHKLFFLFVSGVAFPLLMSSGFGLLFLEEKKKDILEEIRKNASQRLDRIEENFEESLTQRELRFKDLRKKFFDKSLTLDQIAEILKTMVRQLEMEAFFIMSSEKRVLFEEVAHKECDFRKLLEMPLRERLKEMRVLFKKNDPPEMGELECLLGKKPMKSIEPKLDPTNRKMIEKIISMLLEDTINYARSLTGKPLLPPKEKAGVGIEGLMDDDNQGLFKFLKLSLGKLIRNSRFFGSGHLFTDVLTTPSEDTSYFLLAAYSNCSAQQRFLEREFADSTRFTEDGELRAVGFETPFSPNYPGRESDPYQKVHERLKSSNGQTLVFKLTVNGREVEVVCRQGRKLFFIDLLHSMPVKRLDEKLISYKRQVIIFIAGTCIFSFLLGILLLQTLVVPIYSMVDGISAIHGKKFEHRVPVLSEDELGKLCRTLNKTIAHLGEMEMAASIQATLYPDKSLLTRSHEIIGKNAMTQAIGGDYFDFFPITENRIAIVLGDVAGHGVSAALVTAMAKAGFIILCPMFWDKPEMILRKLNSNFLQILRRNKMMTCILGILDTETNLLECVNAGQASPILVSDDGAASYHLLVSNPLGIVEKVKIKTAQIHLEKQDIVLYTDGLVEALTPSNESLGYEKFREFVESAFKAEKILPTDAIFEKVRTATDPIPWNDDATVLVLKRRVEK